MWFIGVEVEQETSAPSPEKILDPPLHLLDFGKTLWESSKIFVEHGLHVIGVQFLNTGLTVMRLIQWLLLRPLFYQQMNACTQKFKYTLKRSSCSPKFFPLKLPKTSCSTEPRGWGTPDFK